MEKRKVTISSYNGKPFLRLCGKWLKEERGLEIGNQLEILESKNCLILIKIPEHIIQERKFNKEIKSLHQQINDFEEKFNSKGNI